MGGLVFGGLALLGLSGRWLDGWIRKRPSAEGPGPKVMALVLGLLGLVPFFATVSLAAWLVPWARVELVVAVVLVGDAAAALVGTWRRPRDAGRSARGTVAYLVAGTVVALVWTGAPAGSLALGAVAAAGERMAGALHVDDNWVAPPLTVLVARFLELPLCPFQHKVKKWIGIFVLSG